MEKNLILVKGQSGNIEESIVSKVPNSHHIDDAVRINVNELKIEVENSFKKNENVFVYTKHYHCGIDSFFRSIAQENEAEFTVLTIKN